MTEDGRRRFDPPGAASLGQRQFVVDLLADPEQPIEPTGLLLARRIRLPGDAAAHDFVLQPHQSE